jgi:hypothetical protein
MRRRVLAIIIGLFAAFGGTLIVTTTPAFAVTDQLCDHITVNNGPAGECFNAWNGGPYVKTYTPNVTNDNFTRQFIHGRCNSTIYTTTNCPLPGTPAGLAIDQIEYLNHPGECVADLNGSSGDAHTSAFGKCNDPNTGFGGDYGTVFVENNCTPNPFLSYVSVHWSTNWGSGARFLGYNGSGGNGNQFWQNLTASGNTVCFVNF